MFKPFSCNNIMKTKYLSPINLLLLKTYGFTKPRVLLNLEYTKHRIYFLYINIFVQSKF